jgi:hypothetical protein
VVEIRINLPQLEASGPWLWILTGREGDRPVS